MTSPNFAARRQLPESLNEVSHCDVRLSEKPAERSALHLFVERNHTNRRGPTQHHVTPSLTHETKAKAFERPYDFRAGENREVRQRQRRELW